MGPCKSKAKKCNYKIYDTLAISFLILDIKDDKSIDECYENIKNNKKINKKKFKNICEKNIIPYKDKLFSQEELIDLHDKIFI